MKLKEVDSQPQGMPRRCTCYASGLCDLQWCPTMRTHEPGALSRCHRPPLSLMRLPTDSATANGVATKGAETRRDFGAHHSSVHGHLDREGHDVLPFLFLSVLYRVQESSGCRMFSGSMSDQSAVFEICRCRLSDCCQSKCTPQCFGSRQGHAKIV